MEYARTAVSRPATARWSAHHLSAEVLRNGATKAIYLLVPEDSVIELIELRGCKDAAQR